MNCDQTDSLGILIRAWPQVLYGLEILHFI